MIDFVKSLFIADPVERLLFRFTNLIARLDRIADQQRIKAAFNRDTAEAVLEIAAKQELVADNAAYKAEQLRKVFG